MLLHPALSVCSHAEWNTADCTCLMCWMCQVPPVAMASQRKLRNRQALKVSCTGGEHPWLALKTLVWVRSPYMGEVWTLHLSIHTSLVSMQAQGCWACILLIGISLILGVRQQVYGYQSHKCLSVSTSRCSRFFCCWCCCAHLQTNCFLELELGLVHSCLSVRSSSLSSSSQDGSKSNLKLHVVGTGFIIHHHLSYFHTWASSWSVALMTAFYFKVFILLLLMLLAIGVL